MIIVHDGKAHTDDFLATCVLLHKLNCRAIRTKANQEHLDDPNCWVIDQGRDFNPDLKNFDHHHMHEEICALTMVLDYYYGKGYRETIPQFRFIEIMDSYGPKAASKFCNVNEEALEIVYNPICSSMIDVFSKVVGELNDPLYSVMKMMGESICQYIENTQKLLNMIGNGVEFVEFKNLSVMNVLNCKLEEGFSIEELPTKKYCKLNKKEADVILTKDSRGGGYRMVSGNTDKLKFVPSENAYFVHNSGFLVGFKNLDDYKIILNQAIESNSNPS